MARDYPQAREIAEGGVQTGGRQEPGRVDRCLSQRGICCTDLPRRHGLAGKAAARHWRQRTSREADRELHRRCPRGLDDQSLGHCLETLTDAFDRAADDVPTMFIAYTRSEEHTSELQSLMRISYAVFCLKKK